MSYCSRQQQGFTLLEVMLVMVLMSIAVSATILSVGGNSEEQQLKQHATRLGAVVQFAQEQALLSGYDYGIYSDEISYQFVRLEKQRWTAHAEPPFQPVKLKEPIYLKLTLDDFAADQGYGKLGLNQESLFAEDFIEEEEEAQLIPQIFILSSGEITPFSLQFLNDESSSYWQLKSDDLGQLQITKSDGDED